MSLVIVSQFLLPAVVVSIPNLPVPRQYPPPSSSLYPPCSSAFRRRRRVALFFVVVVPPIPFLLMSFPLLVVGLTPRTCRRWAVFIGFGRLRGVIVALPNPSH